MAAPPPGVGRGAFLLKTVAEIPVPGPAVRFDYQSLDTTTDRLYVAHMDAGTVLVVDVKNERVVTDLSGFPQVHGVWVVPQLERLYASVTGRQQVAVVDLNDFHVIAKIGRIDYPDGIAYAPNVRRIFVSDEHGGTDAVIDVFADTLVRRIPLGGEAGNTVYDPVTACIFVAVHEKNEIAVINPETNQIVEHIALPAIERPHGIVLDVDHRVAFVAGEGNARLAVLDLKTEHIIATYSLGEHPDVLALDPSWGRLYVGTESGTVSAFTEVGAPDGIRLVRDGDFSLPHAHTVAVDPRTHLIYLPLQDVDGAPMIRVMIASPPGR